MKTKLLIFGISGDLSRRKLLPALQSIVTGKAFDSLEIIGVSRSNIAIADLLRQSTGSSELASISSIFSMDMATPSEYHRLKEYLAVGEDEQLLMYLSVPPSATRQIISLLGEAGFTTPNVKLLLEKPFGVDLVSAEDMNSHIRQYFTDEQVYRIDHYLAKEMAQNIIAFRSGNAMFDHVWDARAIESIELVASEKIGIEGRAQFYEQTGALRDVIQGHLIQLLALTLMDIPSVLDWDKVPALRLKALDYLKSADPQKALRAQYEGYEKEVENTHSHTETFVSLELTSQDPRWQGVPLRLITGKGLHEKTTEIRINFKKAHDAQQNRLTLRVQPNEGVEIDLYTKKPGYEREFEVQKLAFSYPDDAHLPDAYEQVLVDAVLSRKSLFSGSDEVLASWRILQPLLDAWSMDDAPLVTYPFHSTIDDILS